MASDAYGVGVVDCRLGSLAGDIGPEEDADVDAEESCWGGGTDSVPWLSEFGSAS